MGIFKIDPERVNEEKKYALGEEKTYFSPCLFDSCCGSDCPFPDNFSEGCLYSLNCRKDTEYYGSGSERKMGMLNE
jgi:hypothetical protein